MGLKAEQKVKVAGEAAAGQPRSPLCVSEIISPFSISKADIFLTYKLNASLIMILITHLGGNSLWIEFIWKDTNLA